MWSCLPAGICSHLRPRHGGQCLAAKESLLPLMKRNPELFDPELDLMHTVRLSLAKPQRSPLGK